MGKDIVTADKSAVPDKVTELGSVRGVYLPALTVDRSDIKKMP